MSAGRQNRQVRVLVARLFHESHGFNPFGASEADFSVLRGPAAIEEASRSDSTLGGIVRRLTASGTAVVASVSAAGPPGGLVEHAFFERMRDEIVQAARTGSFDAIALDLHGAMGTPVCPDTEGDLLRRLREAVGPDVPICVGLDLHAHVTPAMLEATDICIACKENPHSDVAACGEKVAEGLLAILSGRFSPVQTLAKVRMLIQGAQETATGPLRKLHDMARRLAAADPSIWDISIYNVYRALDDIDMGQAVVVVSNGQSAGAFSAARMLSQTVWEWRDQFVDDLREIDAALSEAEANAGNSRYALADMGDRVLAGAPGDSTAILSALIARGGPLKAAVPVTDPKCVERATSLGVGSVSSFELGGRLTPGFKTLSVIARVISLSDGSFRIRGPYLGGETSSLGPTAVLQIGDRLTVIATSKPGFTHDPEAFEAMGVPVAAQDVIVVKSGYHFTLNFAGLAEPLMVRTPGIGYYTPGQFRWRLGRFWPEHDVPEPIVGPISFSGGGSGALMASSGGIR